MKYGLTFLAIAVAAGPAIVQQPVRDAAATASTASISGAVYVDGNPTTPARRVRVTLTNVAQSSPGQTTTTDDRGAFIFRDVPAGRFELQAFKHGYLRSSYGATRPERTGTPVVVSVGDALQGLAMSIVRGGVIAGMVRDARGRAVPGTAVRVLRLSYNGVSGERTLAAPGTGSVTMTDDRGEYRAFGVPPGVYLVLLPGPPSGRGNEPVRQLTSAEVAQALRAARGSSSAVPGAAPPPPPSAPARLSNAPVFHPGVTDIGGAATIALGVGEERSGVDVVVQLVPTATISGTITSPTGTVPPTLSIRLVPAGPQTELLAGAGLRGVSTQLQTGGRYAFTGVAPGTYTVRAIHGRGRGAKPDGPTLWAAAEVQMSGDDIVVPLTLQPGVPVNGRVTFEGAPPTAAELQTLSFSLVAPASGEAQTGGQVDGVGRFSFASVTPDAYRFAFSWSASSARDRWTMKSSTANGRDAFDDLLRVSANEPVDWTVTFTDRPTTLTGALTGAAGRPATEYYVLVFSANRAHWTPASRRIRMTRPATDGTFIIKGLPPGEYLFGAVLDLEPGEWTDPSVLEQLVRSSAKISLRDGETITQNYKVGGA
jgi:hypothetical protein